MEEDIKILEELKNKQYTNKDILGNLVLSEEEYTAIEHLIEKNKELEEKMNFVQPFVSLTNRMVNKILGDNDYIPKSKIKEKIEELDKRDMTIYIGGRSNGKTFQQAVRCELKKVLQELLED